MIVIFPHVLRSIGNGPARSCNAAGIDEDERDFADAWPKPGHDGGKPRPSRSSDASNQPPGGMVFVGSPLGVLLPHGPAGTSLVLTAVFTVASPCDVSGGLISSHGHGFSFPLSGPWHSGPPRPLPPPSVPPGRSHTKNRGVIPPVVISKETRRSPSVRTGQSLVVSLAHGAHGRRLSSKSTCESPLLFVRSMPRSSSASPPMIRVYVTTSNRSSFCGGTLPETMCHGVLDWSAP